LCDQARQHLENFKPPPSFNLSLCNYNNKAIEDSFITPCRALHRPLSSKTSAKGLILGKEYLTPQILSSNLFDDFFEKLLQEKPCSHYRQKKQN